MDRCRELSLILVIAVDTSSTSEASLAESALLSEESLEFDRRRAASNLARGLCGPVVASDGIVDMVAGWDVYRYLLDMQLRKDNATYARTGW